MISWDSFHNLSVDLRYFIPQEQVTVQFLHGSRVNLQTDRTEIQHLTENVKKIVLLQ